MPTTAINLQKLCPVSDIKETDKGVGKGEKDDDATTRQRIGNLLHTWLRGKYIGIHLLWCYRRRP